MTDAFAELVMPVFRKGIDLQDRLSGGESRSLDEVKRMAGDWIEEARRRAMGAPGLKRSYDLAQYGLVAWIDEVLTESAWGRKAGSPDQILEWDLFCSRRRATLFYDHADVAGEEGDLDAMEVYLLAVTLGFRGKYRGGGAIGSDGWDADLERERSGFESAAGVAVAVPAFDDRRLADWVHRMYDRISGAGGVPDRPFGEDPPLVDRFGPLRGPSLLLRVSVLVAITAIVTLAAYLIAVHVRYNANHPEADAGRLGLRDVHQAAVRVASE